VCVDGDGDERVFRVPAGVRVDRDRRTGGGQGGLRTDGGQSAATTARTLTVGDRVRVAGEQVTGGLATIERIDDSPPVASELFEGARHLFLDADGERIGCSSTRLRPTTTRSILRRPTPASTAPGNHKVPARGSNAWNAGTMTAGMVSLGYAVFLATAILSFVGAFIMIMTARIVTRLFTMHR